MEPFENDVPSCALMLGDPVSGEVEQLGETRSCNDRETFPHWSRDGTRIVYYRAVFEGETAISAAVYVLDVASAEETKLTDDAIFAGDADWSSDDEWIVFSTYPLRDFQCCEVSNLYRIHPDGSGLEQLTDYATAELRATQPRYTPDGEWIVFTAVSPEKRVPWVIPADGGDPISVASSGIFTHPAWQPGD
jgi:Tol biopolymer transport system component